MLTKLRQSLRIRFMLVGCLITAALCLVLSWYFLYQSSELLERELEKRGLATIQGLARTAQASVLAEDIADLDRLVNGIMADPDLVHAVIARADRSLLVDRTRTKESPALPAIPSALTETRFQAYENLEGDLFYHAVAPIGRQPSEGSGQPIGYVQLAFSPEGIHRAMQSIFRTSLLIIIGIAVMVTLLGTGVMSRLIQQVTRPVHEMAETALRMADGDLSQTVTVSSADEIGVLALAFNRMSHSLRERTNQLHFQTMQLQATNEAMERANQVKSEFLSNVSHELRTPLTSIRSFSEILMTYGDEDPETRQEFLAIINQESERLTRLVNDVLDLSKIEAGRMDWHVEPRSIEALLSRVQEIMQGMAEAAGLTLEVKVPASLPELPFDEDRMIQVLTNLVNNAIKFTEEGQVILEAAIVEDAVQISVTDTGIGIPVDQQQHVFEKFHQVGNVLTDKPKGTGLGLAICKQIVEHHLGRVWVESEPGVGSQFHIQLPLDAADTLEPEPVTPSDEPLKLATAQTSALILVADDEPNIRRSLCFALGKMNYATLEACTGQQALELAQKHLPDLLILDIMMPEMDGFDVIRAIREHQDSDVASIPILATSILEFQDKAIQFGANDYHPKPIDRLSLLYTVRNLIPQQAKKILVVDDEPPIRRALCFELEKAGYETCVANDGHEGLLKCQQEIPDLIILDIMMPVMTGYEMLQKLRSDPELGHTPVIVLTANGLRDGKAKALGLGAQQYLTKGEQFRTLLNEIRILLDNRRSTQYARQHSASETQVSDEQIAA